ncbi:30S ribosomal protein S6 [Candidatus Kinetoplastibacterium sorsogonicusi]|uniref:Small ribosomal subunit protein bS6 n=1 Tax=Candidatus Kinetoplastidibacterium kentomonadis TaxID=1576550 RepID=A0A3S7J9X8_9PROT|nr:30S ribosomal protein S6 [Candidatus Kinetoplastibacterium sorsogonicusi]AWD32475.1 30S ribosomal protein S6 [Candidatus Kinetoplastibacterium sorsogonicusi]
MRHYEVVIIIHPDQSDQSLSMIDRYKNMVTNKNGIVHRSEDWGKKQLAYPIKKLVKAHYICLNIECNNEVLSELMESFKYNDAILRHLIIKKKNACTSPSIMMKTLEKEDSKKNNTNDKSNEQ